MCFSTFGLGAYGFGLIMQRTGVPIPVAFIGTLLITTIVATVTGALCVRLKEIYFAFVTLAFQMLIHSVILSWVSLTGGDQGLRGGIPRPVFLGIDLSNHMHLYVVSCALLVIGLLSMRQIAQSPFGYTLRMIRDNATRASFIGIDVWRAKLTIFVLAALFASTGGMIMSLFVSGAYPEFAYWTISGEGIFHQHARRCHHLPRPDGRNRTAADLERHRYSPDRVLRHRTRHRDPVFRDGSAQRPDGLRGRMVRATARWRQGTCAINTSWTTYGGLREANV
jgi:hypothetical protein